MIAHGVYIKCSQIDAPCEAAAQTCPWSGFSANPSQLWASFKDILDIYILKDIPQSDWFISLTNSTNSISTVVNWHRNQARQQQGLVPDPDLLLIRGVGLLIISWNVSFIHHVWYPQNWLICCINYFHKFNLNIRLLTYEPSKEKQGLFPDPDFLRIQESGMITILRPVRDVGLWYSQICLIYINKYFNTFKLYILLLTYKPSEGKTRTRSGSGFSPDTGHCFSCFHT